MELEIVEQSFTQKRADALIFMSEHLLATCFKEDQGQSAQLATLSGGEKYQVMIHIDAGAHHEKGKPHDEAGTACCQLDNGTFLSPISTETARRLACDASLVTVMEDSAGNVLNVGRKTRSIPPAIRRALKLRDHGCRFPGCCESHFVDAHHIQHWCDGGETSLDNLLLLCRHHHRLLHQELYSIQAVGKKAESGNKIGKKRVQELIFINAQGKQIEQALFPQFRDENFPALEVESDMSLSIELENADLGLEIDDQTAVTARQGESMDYGLAVDALIESGNRP